MAALREMAVLSPVTYFDPDNSIRLNCYADTFVYHKASGKERNLVAMRFGGYPEEVRAMADALRNGAGLTTVIEGHTIILKAQHKAYMKLDRSVFRKDRMVQRAQCFCFPEENSAERF